MSQIQRDYRPDWQRTVQNQTNAGTLLMVVFVVVVTVAALFGFWTGH